MARKKIEDEETDVHFIGKINKALYSCVTDDITTDEVIITDERIQHIKAHHPKDYERFAGYMTEIIARPDYILATNLSNTAFILKRIEDNGELFDTHLRPKF